MSRTSAQLIEGPKLLELSLKRCYECDRILHLLDFFPAKLGLGGRRSKCKSCLSAQSMAWAARNRDVVLAAAARPHRREAARKRRKERRLNQRDRVLAQQRQHNAKRRADPMVRLRDQMGRQIWRCLRGTKGASFVEHVDWTVAELRAHLERQFLRGMTWGNYGEWHVDHIIPISSFTITGPDDPELRRAWALTNLRPLWALDNISKGAKRLTLL